MRAGGPEPRFDRVMYRPRRSPTLRKSLVITLSTAALIVVLALAILGVLTAVAGQQSGLDRPDCARAGCEARLCPDGLRSAFQSLSVIAQRSRAPLGSPGGP
jgi:hypothetical protein